MRSHEKVRNIGLTLVCCQFRNAFERGCLIKTISGSKNAAADCKKIFSVTSIATTSWKEMEQENERFVICII